MTANTQVTRYAELVQRQSSRNPCIEHLDIFINRTHPHLCNIEALEFDGRNIPHRRDVKIDDLEAEIVGRNQPPTVPNATQPSTAKESSQPSATTGGAPPVPVVQGARSFTTACDAEPPTITDSAHKGKILLVEDITPSVIETLGSKLDIDPLFFASHLDTPSMQIDFLAPDKATLPSRLKSSNFVNIHYHRTIVFDEKKSTIPEGHVTLERDGINILRKVSVLSPIKNVRIGLAQHCVSIYKTMMSNNEWLAIVLTDPGITENYRRKVEQSKDKETYYSNLFAKGYEDFMAHSNADVDNDRCKDLRYDLRHYWEANVHDYSTVAPTLLSLSYYPLQIVAREWVNYMAVMSHSVKEYEPKSEPMQDPDTGMDLKELQRWRRRALSSQQKIGAGLRFIRDNTSGEPPASQAQWSACLEDWEYNSQGLKACSALLENMAQVAQIVDGRRSAEETRNTTRLTTLALIFFPLSLFASIFSMTDSFSPGKRLFGVYFAVAIPVCVILYFMVRPPKGVEEWLEKRSKTRRQIKTRKKREAKKDKAATEGEKAQQSEKARKAKTPPTSAPNAALENTHFNVV